MLKILTRWPFRKKNPAAYENLFENLIENSATLIHNLFPGQKWPPNRADDLCHFPKDLQLVIDDLRGPFKSYLCHIGDEKLAGDLEFKENVVCRLSVWSVFLFYNWLSQVNLTFLTLFDLIWPSQVRLNTFVSRVATVFSIPE